ncbi:MAG: 2-oxoacid:acceptor oxidoreductase family protein [Archaeoglobaceae archaeon]|nr:2-oxoacid:acceptor oxidoreductase family protein [Archaeoglobaceae archaeon]MDW7989738.1 2-oxoacid:acceptor oxidoreductase family protein [Archaeoglobaceae archaeon]
MLIELIIYSRGGQGGVTAARFVGTAAMLQGFFAQTIPQFGPERRGARVYTYLRISDKQIRKRSQIKNPNCIALFDKKIEIKDGTNIAIVNSREPLKLAEKTFYVDATSIAEKYGLINAGWPILSAPMSGAITRAIGIETSYLIEAIKIELGEKAEKSCLAAKEAHEVVNWI